MPGPQRVSPFRIGLPGLPPAFDQLAAGFIYGLACDQQSIRLPLVAAALAARAGRGGMAVLVTSVDPAVQARKLALSGLDVGEMIGAGELKFFCHTMETGRDLFVTGTQRLLRELDGLGLPDGTLILADGADRLFCLADPGAAVQATRAWDEWLSRNDHALLATFSPPSDAPRDFVTLRTVADGFGGFAVVRGNDEEVTLDIRHWFGAQGPVPRRRFALSVDEGGRLFAHASLLPSRALVPIEREWTVATRPAAIGLGMPTQIRFADTLLDVIDKARLMPAGTVVLHFDRASQVAELARTVAAVRALGKAQVRVVIRECKARLRAAQSIALLRLGASSVLSADLTDASVRLTVAALSGTLFSREVETDVDAVLSGIGAPERACACSFSDMTTRVEDALRECASVDLPLTLIQLSPASPQAADSVHAALRKGARDAVLSERGGSLWLLLKGCSALQAEPALARLLGRRFDMLLAGWQHWSDAQEIRTTLANAASFDTPNALRAVVTPIGLRRAVGMLAFVVAALAGATHDRPALAATTAEQFRQQFDGADYSRAARTGAHLLAERPDDRPLRLEVANALAWSGRYDAAIGQYEKLFGTDLDSAARLGVANIQRWRGMADVAADTYEAVLRKDPGNADARAALALAGRDLRAATTFRVAGASTSSQFDRLEGTVSHRWWTRDRFARLEVGGTAQRNDSPADRVTRRELSANVFLPGLPLSPRLDVSWVSGERDRTFGRVGLELVRDRFGVRFGRIDWGRAALDMQALRDGLTAGSAGGWANFSTVAGEVRARADGYSISDGNKVLEADLRLLPVLQPIPGRIQWFVGGYWRKADRNDPRYWSPAHPYSVVNLGVQRGWYGERHDVFVSVQRGFSMSNEARSGWSVSGNGRWWIAPDTALSAEVSWSDTPRPNPYRQRQVAVSLQQLW